MKKNGAQKFTTLVDPSAGIAVQCQGQGLQITNIIVHLLSRKDSLLGLAPANRAIKSDVRISPDVRRDNLDVERSSRICAFRPLTLCRCSGPNNPDVKLCRLNFLRPRKLLNRPLNVTSTTRNRLSSLDRECSSIKVFRRSRNYCEAVDFAFVPS